jgi:DNA-binding CsgD family transcriptional regulator
VKFAEEAQFLVLLSYVHVERARLECSRGLWDAAVRSAELSLDTSLPVRCPAITVIGRVAARRGQPEAASLLWTAWDLAVKAGELQRTGPVAVARAEAAWLHGDRASVRDIALPVYQEAVRLDDRVHQAELGYWLAKAGQHVQPPGDHPYAVQAAGRWREAATLWESAGCPYEQATALADSHDPEHMLTALGMLDELAAKPLATKVRRRLRALGVARIPRGPLTETRVNPAGLTGRQVDVLRLLGQGFTNAQIASQLVVSVRTVDSHVAAVLGKLGTASRQEAGVRDAELGLLDAPNQ